VGSASGDTKRPGATVSFSVDGTFSKKAAERASGTVTGLSPPFAESLVAGLVFLFFFWGLAATALGGAPGTMRGASVSAILLMIRDVFLVVSCEVVDKKALTRDSEFCG